MGIIEGCKLKPGTVSQREAEAYYLKAMEEVGKKLGHVVRRKGEDVVTARTAIKAYLNPTIQRQFFIDLGLQVPKFIAELT